MENSIINTPNRECVEDDGQLFLVKFLEGFTVVICGGEVEGGSIF